MFGYVSANWKELNDAQKKRYQAAYCGVCRRIREQSGNVSRLGLSYDMAFLGLLLSSLYEPEEEYRHIRQDGGKPYFRTKFSSNKKSAFANKS